MLLVGVFVGDPVDVPVAVELEVPVAVDPEPRCDVELFHLSTTNCTTSSSYVKGASSCTVMLLPESQYWSFAPHHDPMRPLYWLHTVVFFRGKT